VILAEVARQPAGLLEQIIEDRAIARAIATVKTNPKATGELADLVRIVQFELVKEELDAEKKCPEIASR
jgi:hypothetical protein